MSFADNTKNYAKLMDILAGINKPLRRMDDGLNNIQDDLQGKETYELIGL
jgi:hypothetical protein